jgi:Rrf2 family transcriptional regulator, nitric oxide-sensitive transcriptional repressor
MRLFGRRFEENSELMRLTAYTDYSFRVLIALALHDGALTTIADIARAYGISQRHLTKVVHQLGRAGYIETVRGRGGGMRLGKAPRDIPLGEVVRRMEPDFDVVECFRGHGRCAIQRACGLSGVLVEARNAFLGVLDRYTMEDLVVKPQVLAGLLAIAPARVADRRAAADRR